MQRKRDEKAITISEGESRNVFIQCAYQMNVSICDEINSESTEVENKTQHTKV